jgi:hypothetical protein
LSLTDADVAPWFWQRLRNAFPVALAAILMPNHPHLITSAATPQAARLAMRSAIGALRRRAGPGADIRWEPVPLPTVIPNLAAARRQIRYVALNPARAGLVSEALSWTWSTHRDVVGAVQQPWVAQRRLATALGRSPNGFAERWHRYVTADPSTDVAGTAFPRPSASTDWAQQPLADVLAAAAACTRRHVADVRKRGVVRPIFIALAIDQGWRDTALLARVCGVTPAAVRLQLARSPPDLRAARLCLGDARLLAEGRAQLGAAAAGGIMPGPAAREHGQRAAPVC